MRILCEFDNPHVIARAAFWLQRWPKRNKTEGLRNARRIRARKESEKQLRRVEQQSA